MAALTVRAGCRAVSTGELSVLAGVLAIASACGESDDSRRPRQVAAEVSENIATVINVHWTTDEASRGYVQYGSTKAMNHKTPVEREATTHHAATLLGLSEDAEIYYQAVSWDEDDVVASRQATIHTGDLPVGLPVLSQRGEGHELFTSVPILGVTTAVTIINPKGEIVVDFHGVRRMYTATGARGEAIAVGTQVRIEDKQGHICVVAPLMKIAGERTDA